MTEISKKKILFVSSVSDFYKFILNNMKICLDLGMDVSYACNLNTRAGEELKQVCTNLGIHLYHVEFARSPYSKQNIKAYKQLKELVEKENFDILDTHTPMASVISRWICKKRDMKIMYTAHGFHFFKGAPLKNWLLYYPIEKYLSKYTDILITINKEDYQRAKDKFKMKQLEYIPGVGIDTKKFSILNFDRDLYRKKLGLSMSDVVIISVGEVNANKNHEIIIDAIAKLDNCNIKYLIAGTGNKQMELKEKVSLLKLDNQVCFLGYRSDVPELLNSCDIFAFPSIREGLGLAAIEAMAAGLPLITSDTRGINDYSIDGITGYKAKFNDIESFLQGIKNLVSDKNMQEKFGKHNRKIAGKYDIKNVESIMSQIYMSILK
ncbi:glycosyltransferase family 4 protein [Ligilactobacillus sp. Marseille-Q7487]|uniref:glycosyltransferase family 4 protein n=1 Tax=Ligilactobacillus sp. Marseille-Q7487 TaxID=3022128 RepID=UPI0024A97FFD|nr:glycosyltransferase family 4 protein [Ligilactobacillus sp. Marseille-Q7487]